jgi:hypothetical protein
LRPNLGNLEGGDPAWERLLNRNAARLDDDEADLDRAIPAPRPAAGLFLRPAAPAGGQQH